MSVGTTKSMRAMVVRRAGGPEELVCEQVPVPQPGPTDVLVKVAACGVCFHDIVTRNGVMKLHVSMPVIVGHEVAGTVEQVGSQVRGFAPGDRVASTAQRYTCGICRPCRRGQENQCLHKVVLGDAGLNGGYAEYAAIDQRSLAIVPDNVPLDQAAVVGCAICTELNALRDVARLVAGESVLVTGAGGGVGIHGVQVARELGAYVIAATTSSTKVDAIKDAGAHEVVLFDRAQGFSDEVRRLTDGQGVDVVADNVGTPLFTPTRKSIAFGGRWVMIGPVTGDFVPFNPAQLFLRHVSLLSGNGSVKLQLVHALRMVERGQLRPIIDATLPLERAGEAHARMEQSAAVGRIVLKPSLAA